MIPSPQRNVGRKNADEVIFCHIKGDVGRKNSRNRLKRDKQKTAYEIVVGDWSSDVCSSDLSHQNGNVCFLHSNQLQI